MEETIPEDTRKPSKAMVCKLLELNGLRSSLKQVIKNSVETASEIFLKNIEAEKRQELVERFTNDEKYMEAFSQIYAEYLTASDVLDLIAFHRTPTGQKMTTLQVTISKRLVDATQELITNTYVKIMAKAMVTNFEIFKDQLKDLGIEDTDIPE